MKCLQVNFSKIADPKKIFVQEIFPQLIIVNEMASEEIFNIISSSDIFLLTKSAKYALLFNGVVEVAQFYVGTESFSIFRMVSIPIIFISIQTIELNSTSSQIDSTLRQCL